MPSRTNTAHFLLGFFGSLTCAMLGIFESLVFHKSMVGGILLFTLIPLAGALKSKQRILTSGLLAGCVVSIAGYYLLR